RWLGSLAVTSTIRARPRGSRWVNSGGTGRKCRGRSGVRAPGAERPLQPSAADLAHRAVGTHEIDLADSVPRPLRGDGTTDRAGQAIVEVGGVEPVIGAQDGAQIRLVEREQTRAELPLGGDTDAIAVVAERLR